MLASLTVPMKGLRKAGLLVVAAGAIAAIGAGCGGGGGSAQVEDLPDGVVAQVGDQSLTEAELTRAVDQQRAQAEQQGVSFPAAGSEGFEQVRRQALETLVLQRVVNFEARRCGEPCKVTKKDVDAELQRIIDQEFNGSQEEFDTFLQESNITPADARRILRFSLQQPLLFNRVTRGVRFSDKDAREFYDANRSQFQMPAGRTASHILVETEEEASALREQATPENFGELAEENSTDEGSAEQGGDLGVIQRGQLVPPFEEVAFALKDGEISQPVETQFGWHLILVDITPAQTTPFAEARQQIKVSQLQAARQEEFTEWRDGVIEDWNDRTSYADETLLPAEQPDQVVPQDPAAAPPPPQDGTGG